jgi:hypothetical protein
VRDLWARRDQASVRGAIRTTLAPHASTLLGLTAQG